MGEGKGKTRHIGRTQQNPRSNSGFGVPARSAGSNPLTPFAHILVYLRMLTLMRPNTADSPPMQPSRQSRPAHLSPACCFLLGWVLAAALVPGRAAGLSGGNLLGFTADSSAKERAL